MNPFKGRHFQRDIILWAVRWYCKYGISYRELQEMLAERGVNVDHSTIYRWVQRYAPEMEKRLRWYWRNPGQKQRVALARALAVEPQILLLDEPFGALDAQVRKELRRWLRQLHEELKFTSVFVTHDQEEATEVADRVVVMSQG
ncbi:ATP-binding cassette domain-containing protein, partial [Escherichia coli]|uniref:ATP-binding cassette domain-containing protein n=1 Tax=Escherichia coli TaxID=562 RepID=UPI00237FA630